MKHKWIMLLATSLLFGFQSVSAEETQDMDSVDFHNVYVFTEEDELILERDVFAKITEVTAVASVQQGMRADEMARQDYAMLIPHVIEAIESSETYVPGTLLQNGDFLVWETTIGMPCCYDPRMEEKLHRKADATSLEEANILEDRLQSIMAESMPTGRFSSKRIALIQPYWESEQYYADEKFAYCSPRYKEIWEMLCNMTGQEGIRLAMKNATINNIADTIESCGLVFIDSHGNIDHSDVKNSNTSYLCLTSAVGITSADTAMQMGEYGFYYNAVKGNTYAYVNGTCISNHMDKNSDGGLLYLAFCYGLGTDEICRDLHERGVEAFWGYSNEITFSGDLKYMLTIVDEIKNGSSFGEAATLAKDLHGHYDPYCFDRYTPEEAIEFELAFAVSVSLEDPYPGREHLEEYRAVHSKWTLFDKPMVQVNVNNNLFGSVIVDDLRIQANPNAGFYAAGYELLEGNADVIQDGNLFYIQPCTDCILNIIFSEKRPMALTCEDNDHTRRIDCQTGDWVILPMDAAVVEGWNFVGWSMQGFTATSIQPAYYGPGESIYVQKDMTMHAVYMRHKGFQEPTFQLIQETLEDWTGQYVITWHKTNAMYLLRGLEPGRSYEHCSDGHSALEETGIRFNGDVLQGVSGEYIFDIVHSSEGNCYTIHNAAIGQYVSDKGGKLRSNYVYLKDRDDWNLAMQNDGTVVMKCNDPDAGPCSFVCFDEELNRFMASDLHSEIYLWKESSAKDTWYTISPELKIVSQPTDVFVSKVNAVVKTSLVAQGDELCYQWYLKNPGDQRFSKSSVTSSTYSVKMTEAANGRQIYCVVSDKHGNQMQSNTVTLMLISGPQITAQPMDVSVRTSGTVAMTQVIATGEGLSYQWYLKNANAAKFSKSSITSDTYSVKMTNSNNGRQVYCVVKDRYGTTIQSETATLSIKLEIVDQP